MQQLEIIIARGFGLGLLPKAPGTWGTLGGIPLVILMQDFPVFKYLTAAFLMFLIGLRVCEAATRALKVHDDKSIVWDEIVGYVITMTLVPVTWYWLVFGFFIFRFYDIVKPYPIRQIDQNVLSSFGIMFDDILAGVYSCITLHIIIYVFNTFISGNV